VFARNRSQTAHERTPEERRRAREERENKRNGLPLPDTGTIAEETPPPPPVEEPLSLTEEAPGLEELSSLAEVGPPALEEPLPLPEAAPALEEPPPAAEPARPRESRRSARMSRGVERLRRQRANSHRWYKRLPARLAALLAFLAVGGAIWLLAQSLGGSTAHKPPPAPHVIKVTIPEGYTRAHIAALAKDEGLTGSYLAATVSSSHLHPTRYGAPHGTPNLEGFLFPATYDLYTGASVRRLVNEQLAAFQENFGADAIHRAHALGVTPYQLLTVASMIEREAEVEHDRPLIAAVIYNRLRQGIPLGIDATIRYALNDFSEPLTEAQLRDPSPYNTRLHHGLPPTPIGNPGVASIAAAAHPAHVSYLYYVAAADGCGEHVFSSSYAQFERDAAAYREAVAKNRGRVPACKRR
jgi:YceG-like family